MESTEIIIINKHFKQFFKEISSELEEIKEEVTEDIYQIINKFITIKKQNLYQKINISICILFELFSVISCSLLLVFIPKSCGEHVCSIVETIVLKSLFYNISLSFNFFTLFSFCILYYFEIRRENILIKYLDVNPLVSYNKLDVEKAIELLPFKKKQRIINTHNFYKKYINILIFIYIINVMFSAIIISRHDIFGQTASTFITYILFIMAKLMNVYSVANSENFIFYSAYLTTHLQFNDLDNKYKQLINSNV